MCLCNVLLRISYAESAMSSQALMQVSECACLVHYAYPIRLANLMFP